jgi:hypothetical protein
MTISCKLLPRDPIAPTTPPENEPYALGYDARNDGRPIDENPFPYASRDNLDWDRGWADADREREADDEGGD